MFNISKSRYYLIMDEKDVTTVLNVINKNNTDLYCKELSVSNCGWAEQPTMWFIRFNATKKQYDKIFKELTTIGKLKVDVLPNGQENLQFERE